MRSAPIPLVDVTRRQGVAREPLVHSRGVKRSTRRQDIQMDAARASQVAVEADPFNILVLNYTMTCPLACDYCCYSCGPRRVETMNLDFAMNIVEQAIDLGVFSEFGFTGGEPLVYYDDILALTARMRRAQVPFSMISACDWATDSRSARHVLDPLVANGMSVFTISHDPSHERWVSRDNVRRVADIVLGTDVHLVLCGSFEDPAADLRMIFPEYADRENVSFVTRVVLPTPGRAHHRGITPSYYPGVEMNTPDCCYKRIYHDVTVFWDGEVYPCCSVYNRSTPALSFGNLYNEPLNKVWDKIESSYFLRTMKWNGLHALEAELLQANPNLKGLLPDENASVGPCDRCAMLLKSEQVAQAILQLSEARELAEMRRILAQLEATLDEDTLKSLLLACRED